jgi:hypothetical protein
LAESAIRTEAGDCPRIVLAISNDIIAGSQLLYHIPLWLNNPFLLHFAGIHRAIFDRFA